MIESFKQFRKPPKISNELYLPKFDFADTFKDQKLAQVFSKDPNKIISYIFYKGLNKSISEHNVVEKLDNFKT